MTVIKILTLFNDGVISKSSARKMIEVHYSSFLGEEFHKMVDGKGNRYRLLVSGITKAGDQSFNILDRKWEPMLPEHISDYVVTFHAVRRPIKSKRKRK